MRSLTIDSSLEDIVMWIEEKEHLSAQKAWELLRIFSHPRLTFKMFRGAFGKIQKILSSGASDPGYSYLWRYCILKGVARSNEIFSFADPRYQAQLMRLIHAAGKMTDEEDWDLKLTHSGFMGWFWFIPNEFTGGLLRTTPTTQPLLISILQSDHRDYFTELDEEHIREVAEAFIPSNVGAACVLTLMCAKRPNNENMKPLQMTRSILEARFSHDDPEYEKEGERLKGEIERRVMEIERMLFPIQESYEWGIDAYGFGMDHDITWIARGRRFKTLEVHYRGIGTIMYERIPDELFGSIIVDPSTTKELTVYRWKRTGGCVQDQGCCEEFIGTSVKISGIISDTGETVPDPLPYHETWQDAPCTFVS